MLSVSGVPISQGFEYDKSGLQIGADAHKAEPDSHSGSEVISQCDPRGQRNPSHGVEHSQVGHPLWSF